MMKTIIKLFIVLALLLTGCFRGLSVLNKDEYEIIDTLHVSRNGLGIILGYDVLIKYDSTYHYGSLDTDGDLTYINPRNLKIRKK